MFEDALLEDRSALDAADPVLRRLAEAGARVRLESADAERPLARLSPDPRPRAVIAAGRCVPRETSRARWQGAVVTDHDVLWQPTPESIRATRLAEFADRVRQRRGLDLGDPVDYDRLWRWSVEHLDAFWAEVGPGYRPA